MPYGNARKIKVNMYGYLIMYLNLYAYYVTLGLQVQVHA